MSDSAEEATIGAPLRVLIVDNDEALAQAMREALNREGYHCAIATSGPEGARRIEHESHDLIVTDMVMNEVDGMAILAQAKKLLPESEVVMVTGHASVPVAVEAMQQGAFNFLEKPVTPKRLRAVVGKAADAVRLRKSNQELHQRLDERFGFEGIIFASSKMKQVLERVKRIAPTDASVFIAGESGTGKELIAQAIHQNSPRKAKTLYPLNARAVSEQLVESELFGHVKGAFTDARTDRMGAFEYAIGRVGSAQRSDLCRGGPGDGRASLDVPCGERWRATELPLSAGVESGAETSGSQDYHGLVRSALVRLSGGSRAGRRHSEKRISKEGRAARCGSNGGMDFGLPSCV